ncbi:hypothetical protein DWW29_00945 [Bacteroides fragilis]|nr:hypothetical protein DWY70_06785 [Bacteroides fragilis]RGV02014.1 hypothetical protein DWW29_00945 [Bacteroides fragilis]RHB20997.1 hypothetical protein DW891_17595 [Bacteroides fragilis]
MFHNRELILLLLFLVDKHRRLLSDFPKALYFCEKQTRVLLLSPLGVHCVVKISGFLQYDKRKNEIGAIFSKNPANVLK